MFDYGFNMLRLCFRVYCLIMFCKLYKIYIRNVIYRLKNDYVKLKYYYSVVFYRVFYCKYVKWMFKNLYYNIY